MSISKRFKHRNTAAVAGVATAVLLAGGVGVAAASGTPDTQEVSSQTEGTDEQQGNEEQEPAVNGSVQVQEVDNESEQEESDRLSSQAKITQDEATKAALGAVSGEVIDSELGNENGSLIWEVEVTKADVSQVEVKVDAGNGDILAQEDEDGDEDEDSGEAGAAAAG